MAEEIKFWQNKNEHEVDLIIETDKLTAIEVKYKETVKSGYLYGLHKFIEQYPLNKSHFLD